MQEQFVRSSLVKIGRETFCFSVRYIQLKNCADEDGNQEDEEIAEQQDAAADDDDDDDDDDDEERQTPSSDR